VIPSINEDSIAIGMKNEEEKRYRMRDVACGFIAIDLKRRAVVLNLTSYWFTH
jgi:hypothetical protein